VVPFPTPDVAHAPPGAEVEPAPQVLEGEIETEEEYAP
jgi:hypothetical protein